MQLFETIRITDGIAHNLTYHNDRLNRTRRELWSCDDTIDISDYLTDIPSTGLYRAKLIYDKNSLNTTYYIYKAKIIHSISLLEANVEYSYKYTDRDTLDTLLDSQTSSDEIIISVDGLLTDTTIANIALRQHGIWYTPAKPLLRGTTRARLLDEGQIIARDIRSEDIASYDGLALMNAMIGFVELNHIKIKYN